MATCGVGSALDWLWRACHLLHSASTNPKNAVMELDPQSEPSATMCPIHRETSSQIPQIIGRYQAAFAKHGDSLESVLWTKGRQKIRFVVLTAHIADEGFSILDFGCGLAHLKNYLDERFRSYRYSGADFVPEFIEYDRERHRDATFHLADSPIQVPGDFDHIVMSGIFNLRYGDDDESAFEIVKRILREAFAKARVSLAVDFRRDRTNYREPDAYHQSLASLYQFACDELSPRLRFDLSYMPYEYTMIVFKDSAPLEPDNVYKGYEHLTLSAKPYGDV
jgi:SAM-dependent methyltransferase